MNWLKRLADFGHYTLGDPLPLTQEYLASVEDKLGVTLHSEYRDFLGAIRNSLGVYSPRFAAEDVESSSIGVFFGISSKSPYDLAKNLDDYVGRVPASLMPVASDSCGNLICLGVKAPDTGKVYFWDHEEESGSGFPNRDNLHKIANSFIEFMNKLEPAED